MDRAITLKRTRALLKHVQDAELEDLLWVVQKFAAEGMNRKSA